MHFNEESIKIVPPVICSQCASGLYLEELNSCAVESGLT